MGGDKSGRVGEYKSNLTKVRGVKGWAKDGGVVADDGGDGAGAVGDDDGGVEERREGRGPW